MQRILATLAHLSTWRIGESVPALTEIEAGWMQEFILDICFVFKNEAFWTDIEVVIVQTIIIAERAL